MPKGQQMREVIAVRVKASEKELLAESARAARKTLAEWSRDALLAAGGLS